MTAQPAPALVPVPRKRQPSRDELDTFHQAIIDIIEEVKPATVRGVFYQMETRGLVEKTEQDCRRVQHALDVLREAGRVPWSNIVDGTRIYMKPDSWSDPAAALEDMARSYRKNLWAEAATIPEIWIEKDALSGTIYPVTAEWDVLMFPARGFSSKTFLHAAAENMVERTLRGRHLSTIIYHLGDWDPSGRDAFTAIERTIKRYIIELGGVYIDSRPSKSWPIKAKEYDLIEVEAVKVVHLGVTQEQIDKYGLPLRPMKVAKSQASATRNARFSAEHGEGCVELDAINSNELRSIVREAIEQHLPADKLSILRTIEKEERKGLRLFAQRGAKKFSRRKAAP